MANIEERIKAKLPSTVKKAFITFANMRKEDLKDIMENRGFYRKYLPIAETLKKVAQEVVEFINNNPDIQDKETRKEF